MRKRLWTLLAVIALSGVLLAGCDLRIGYVGSQREGAMTARYKYCTESKTRTVNLQQGDELSFEYDLKVSAGEVSLLVSDPEGDVVWAGEFDQDAKDSFVLEIEQDGKYIVHLELQGARGAYAIAWSK